MTARRIQLWCVWFGPVFIVVFFAGAIMAGLIPPPDATASAQEIADHWREDTDVKRLGLVLMMIGSGLTLPLGIAIAMQMKRIEGSFSPMTYAQIAGATLGVFAINYPSMLFMGVAFRPERDPETTLALMDTAVVPFIINYPPALIQFCSVAVAILADRRERPILPRWLGWYSLWSAFLFLPGALLLFFKEGAWAWDGLMTFWLVATVFGTWFLVMSWYVRKAILAQPDDVPYGGAPAVAATVTDDRDERVPEVVA